MKTENRSKMRTFVFWAMMCVLGVSSHSFAAYPSVLVIGGTAYSGVFVSSSTGSYEKYGSSGGFLVLSGSQGGGVGWGTTGDAAYASLTGTWNGSNTVTIQDHSVVVPQVVITAPSAITPPDHVGI